MDVVEEKLISRLKEDTSTALTLFSETVAKHPKNVAINYFEAGISYEELDKLSDAFAVALKEGGFKPGDKCGIYLQNSPHFPICMMGVFKAGGTVVPISPMNRQRELTLILNDSKPTALVMTSQLYEEVYKGLTGDVAKPAQAYTANPLDFQTTNDQRIFKDPALTIAASGGTDVLATLEKYKGKKPAPITLDRESLAFLVYTSGTTGVPKAAMILHRNACEATALNIEAFDGTGDVRVLGMSPLFHVTGLMSQMMLIFSVGGRMVLNYRFDAGVVLDMARKYKPTHVFGAITAYIAMMNEKGSSPEDVKTIRVLGVGGAPTPPALITKLESFFIGAKIQVGYGLTESTSSSHASPRGSKVPVDPNSGALSVGKTLPGITAWIAGENGEVLGPNEVGEFVLQGKTITAGYFNKPKETSEAYRQDGFRTGDVGFRDDEGWFYLVDRKKDMIVASGFKVWPREVEDVLYTHPSVREAAVVGIPDSYRGETVRAIVSLKPGMTATVEELQKYCKDQMAAYKYPREVRIMDELPKTPSGKILRRELRD